MPLTYWDDENKRDVVVTKDNPLPIVGVGGTDGQPGKSAYEIAADNGFSGTETEWLASLKGEKGEKGSAGTNGTNGAKGDKGDPGTPGTNGADGFPTEAQWNDLAARVTALETGGE